MTLAFDEMYGFGPFGEGAPVRPSYERLAGWLEHAPPEVLATRQQQAELFFRRMGITFAVYGEEEAAERLIPFDIVPRILDLKEWSLL